MKRRIYTDTSVIGGCLDVEFEDASRQLLDMFKTGEAILVLSDLTLLEAVWKQSLYKRRPYVICGARLRTDLLDNRSLTMLLEISKRLIY